MEISVIIVSYNVRYFLEACLNSVFRAMGKLEGEVVVVDNHSVDGSAAMIREKFPEVKLIINRQNKGFSKGCNQGISISKGKYILLLNPDTVIEEETLTRVTEFMDRTPDAGALGVRMIDGKGKFLPESKRSLPTPGVAFFKVFGLARLFPRSGFFNRYALGHLDAYTTQPVEVLSGAFMLIRKEVLQMTGGLDEDYFMYGEDIDLSYRITKAGYRNYYFAGTTIIHYKGESTKRGSLNYVLMFYQAMLLFAAKHFKSSRSSLLSWVLKPAIYLRASLSIFRRMLTRIIYPLLDFLTFNAGYFFLIPVWERIKFHGAYTYPNFFRYGIVLVYTLIWLTGIFLAGGYVRPVRISRLIRGILGSTVFILILYALVPLTLRFSRALIILGAAWALISGISSRYLLSLLPMHEFKLGRRKKKRILVAGDQVSYHKIKERVGGPSSDIKIIGFCSDEQQEISGESLGTLQDIQEIIRIHDINEVIFAAESISREQIIATMTSHADSSVTFRIALPEGSIIIGSDAATLPGELYFVGTNSVTLPENRARKRTLDMAVSFVLFIFSPLVIPWLQKPFGLFRSIFLVVLKQYSWVGFCPDGESAPAFNGILCPAGVPGTINAERDKITDINLAYATDYHYRKDFSIILRYFRFLGG